MGNEELLCVLGKKIKAGLNIVGITETFNN